MPVTEIHITKGKSKEFLIKLMDTTMDTIQEGLAVPEDDRNIRLTEYEKEFFMMKPPYQLFIQINMFAGRTFETKKNLYQKLVDNLENDLEIGKDEVLILINEQPLENWAGRGGVPASEMKLGFKVKV